MTSIGRIFRKIFFGFLFLALLAWIGYGLYDRFFVPVPNCFDKIQNQDEKGVDCEGICDKKCIPPPVPQEVERVKVEWVKAVASGIGVYDLAAKIKNPNKYWGLKIYDYQFIANDGIGNSILSQSGESYLLPDDYDYVIVLSVKAGSLPQNIEFNIFNEDWVNVSGEYDISSIFLPVNGQQFNLKDTSSGLPSASGILVNNTAYDFDRIDIKVALFGSDNNLLGVNITNLDTMLSKEERRLLIVWDEPPLSAVYGVDFKAVTNIFNSNNFMRHYSTGVEVGPYR